VTKAIDDREIKDRSILSEESVRDVGTDQRQEVTGRDESVIDALRFCFRDEKVAHHENGENRSHAVVTKPLGGFVANDVLNLRWELLKDHFQYPYSQMKTATPGKERRRRNLT
jgi:hypothetical protein